MFNAIKYLFIIVKFSILSTTTTTKHFQYILTDACITCKVKAHTKRGIGVEYTASTLQSPKPPTFLSNRGLQDRPLVVSETALRGWRVGEIMSNKNAIKQDYKVALSPRYKASRWSLQAFKLGRCFQPADAHLIICCRWSWVYIFSKPLNCLFIRALLTVEIHVL